MKSSDGLTDLFGIMVDSTSSDSRISQIFGGMQKWYRALPQVTTNVTFFVTSIVLSNNQL